MKYSPSLCRCGKNDALQRVCIPKFIEKYLGRQKRIPNRLNSNENSKTMIKLHLFQGYNQNAKNN